MEQWRYFSQNGSSGEAEWKPLVLSFAEVRDNRHGRWNQFSWSPTSSRPYLDPVWVSGLKNLDSSALGSPWLDIQTGWSTKGFMNLFKKRTGKTRCVDSTWTLQGVSNGLPHTTYRLPFGTP